MKDGANTFSPPGQSWLTTPSGRRHTANAPPNWAMPEWMEPYRKYIRTRGHDWENAPAISVEDLMNDQKTSVMTDVILTQDIVAARGQVRMLIQLHQRGFLKLRGLENQR